MHKEYLKTFVYSFVFAIIFVIFINFLIDPYGIFGFLDLKGFNSLKPKTRDRGRIVKPIWVLDQKPNILIAGNSRVEMGIDPKSPSWKLMRSCLVFNMGLPGASVYMQMRYLQHASNSTDIKLVYFGLDFVDFLISTEFKKGEVVRREEPWDFEKRLKINANNTKNPFYQLYYLFDHTSCLFSYGSFLDSIETILKQGNKNVPMLRKDGFNPAQEYFDIIKHEGQSILFQQKNKDIAKRLSNGTYAYSDDEREFIGYKSLGSFLSFASLNDIKVVFFVNPYHIEYLLLIDLAGKWESFEKWKYKIFEIAQKHNVEIWDFNGVNSFTTEMINVSHDKKPLLWFWEPAHYRKELGDIMISRMVNINNRASTNNKFGEQLDSDNISKHLKKIKEDLTKFKNKNPKIVKKIASLSGMVQTDLSPKN
ncbi:MAG: hypothetical protein GY857_12845 [Desulfobacula sp.]|nr:hypothetical protein [Desulfobacula sp.]